MKTIQQISFFLIAAVSIGLSQSSAGGGADRIKEYKRLSGYAEFAAKKARATSGSRSDAVAFGFDASAVSGLKGFSVKNQSDRVIFNRGIKRDLYFSNSDNDGVFVSCIVASDGAHDIHDWFVGEFAANSSMPVDLFASRFPLKESLVGDFFLGAVDESGRCYGSCAFCHGTICVTISTADKTIDLLALAREIDAIFTRVGSVAAAAAISENDLAADVAIPDSIDRKTTPKFHCRPKSSGTVNVKLGCAAGDGRLRCEMLEDGTMLVVPQKETGTGEIGVVVYDPESLRSKWTTRTIAIK